MHRSVEIMVETDVSLIVIVFTVLPTVTRRLAEISTPATIIAEAIARELRANRSLKAKGEMGQGD